MQHKSSASTKCTVALEMPPSAPLQAPPPPRGGPASGLPSGSLPPAQGCQRPGRGGGLPWARERKADRETGALGEHGGADRGPWPAVGPRALSPNLRAGARTPALQPPPAIQPRGEQGHGPVCVGGGAQAAAGSSPRTCCSCENRLPRQGCCSPVPGWAPPAFGSATRERTANTSVRDEGEMGQGLFGSCGGDPAPSLGCHVPTPSFRQQANQPARPPGPVTRTPVSGSGQVAGSVTGKNLCLSI